MEATNLSAIAATVVVVVVAVVAVVVKNYGSHAMGSDYPSHERDDTHTSVA